MRDLLSCPGAEATQKLPGGPEGAQKVLRSCATHADGDAEELRIVFTHIDAADPQRPFAFGVYVDNDDMYAGVRTAPRQLEVA